LRKPLFCRAWELVDRLILLFGGENDYPNILLNTKTIIEKETWKQRDPLLSTMTFFAAEFQIQELKDDLSRKADGDGLR